MASQHLLIYLILTFFVIGGVFYVVRFNTYNLREGSGRPGSDTPGSDTPGPDTPGPDPTDDPKTSAPSAADMTTLIIVLSVTVLLVILGVFLFMKFGRIQNDIIRDSAAPVSGVDEPEPVSNEEVSADDGGSAERKTMIERFKSFHQKNKEALKNMTEKVKTATGRVRRATKNVSDAASTEINQGLEEVTEVTENIKTDFVKSHNELIKELKTAQKDRENVQREVSFKSG
jgi:hypothetical protein